METAAKNKIDKVIRRHLEQSLKNLQTDYVDLYYLHRVNEAVPLEKVAHVMGNLIREGVILGWGLSQVSGEMLRRADSVTPVSAVQNNLYLPDCVNNKRELQMTWK